MHLFKIVILVNLKNVKANTTTYYEKTKTSQFDCPNKNSLTFQLQDLVFVITSLLSFSSRFLC